MTLASRRLVRFAVFRAAGPVAWELVQRRIRALVFDGHAPGAAALVGAVAAVGAGRTVASGGAPR